MKKYLKIAELLKNRVFRGDYLLREIPAERQLSAEVGASYMTVRRAVRTLVDEGVLVRKENGRTVPGRRVHGSGRGLHLAFLVPTVCSQVVERWRVGLDTAAEKCGGIVKTILYMHWDDPIVMDALETFDGIFIIPVPELPSPELLERIRSCRKAVIVDQDFSYAGIPSVRVFPPVFVQRLLDYLWGLGHRRIDCLAICADPPEADAALKERVGQWAVWLKAHNCTGRLLQSGQECHREPYCNAYRAMKRAVSGGRFDATALLCTTMPAAVGAMRAFYECGIRPGRDVSVCAVDSEGIGGMLVPSLTALEATDPSPYFALCLEWIRGSGEWPGPLLLQPDEAPVAVRESTCANSAAEAPVCSAGGRRGRRGAGV